MKHVNRDDVARAAEQLARQRRKPQAAPFVAGVSADDDLAELLAEQSLEGATSGDHVAENELNADVDEDFGGPFLETSARSQYGHGFDESNIRGAEPAAFPLAVGEPEDDEEPAEEP